MPLSKAQCTNCGQFLEVDPAKDAAVCPYCGTPYIVEKVIQQVNNNMYIQNATIVNENENALTEEKITLEYNRFINELEKGLLPFGYLFYKFPKQFYNSFSEEQKLGIEQKKQEFYNDIKWFIENFKCIKDFADYLSSNNLICKIASKEVLKKNAETGEENWESLRLYNYALKWKPSSNNTEKILLDDDTDYGISPIEGFKPEYGVFLSGSGSLYYALVKADSQQFQVVHDFLGDIEKYTFKFEKVPTSGCYIATCVYGSYDCPEVWTLRRFRDNALASTFAGRTFIKTYYAVSPTLVKWFGNKKWFKKIWKCRLDSMVRRLNSKGYESTQYEDKTL